MGLSALVAGVGSYVLLIVVAKSVSPEGYADFAAFWSIAVTVGLGVYFPIEQETARDYAGRPPSPRSPLARVAFGFAGTVSILLVAAATVLALLPAARQFVGSAALIGALGFAFLGYLVQFPVRGLLSGARRTTAYAATIGAEGVLRVLLPALVVLTGATDPAVFALTVGLAAAVSITPALLSRDRGWTASPAATFASFSSRALRLLVAALTIQLLLNSAVLVARSFDAADPALAGQVLTCLSIARIPVFAYQALQVLYMPRVAASWKDGDIASVRRFVGIAAALVVAVGIVTVAGMALLGPWVIGVFFTPDLVLPEPGLVLLAAGVSVFLLAQVLSDAVLACGGHTVVVGGWLAGLAAAAVALVAVPDSVLRVVLPLGLGALVAAAVFGFVLVRRLAHRPQTGILRHEAVK